MRYFKYAIGEIVLFVIGVLITLQSNNWNKISKCNLLEQKLLVDLKGRGSKLSNRGKNLSFAAIGKSDAKELVFFSTRYHGSYSP